MVWYRPLGYAGKIFGVPHFVEKYTHTAWSMYGERAERIFGDTAYELQETQTENTSAMHSVYTKQER